MASIDLYTKQQVDALIASAGGLPDPTSASVGDVLTLDSNKDPAWTAAASGGMTAHTYTSFDDMMADLVSHPEAIVMLKEYEISISSSVTRPISCVFSRRYISGADPYYDLMGNWEDIDSSTFKYGIIRISKSSPGPGTIYAGALAFSNAGAYSSFYSVPFASATFSNTDVQNHIIVFY